MRFIAIVAFFLGVIVATNLNLKFVTNNSYQSRLVCVNNYIKYFGFGNESQIADAFWMRFLQELDAYNQLAIAEPHLCPDKTSSWHFHIINVAMDLDKKFYELFVHAPLLISITIGDSKGASILFDKSVEYFPDNWSVLYRASYQAQIEEGNQKKAADLLYRAGKHGAPEWVMSLAGGLYNESGNREIAERVYKELIENSETSEAAERLKLKLDNKMKNFFIEKKSEK